MVLRGFSELTASGAETYTWTPGESLSNPDVYNPISYAEDTTLYYVLGIDENGCEGTDSVTVFVLEHITIVAPTAFTPNNDGINDYYRPLMIGPGEILEYSIFNRWGTMLYKSVSSSDRGWDGTFSNVNQEIGGYVVYVKAKDFYGTEIVKSTTFNLLR